jgi:hypothetical protein
MVVAAVLLVASVPHRGTAARSALSQGGPVQSTARAGEYRPQNVAAMVGPQLQELKALPVVKSFMAPSTAANRQAVQSRASAAATLRASRSRVQELAEALLPAPAAGGAAVVSAAKPCDAECEHMKEVGRERMKQLRNEIDQDFTGMVDFAADAAYVPPVESMEQQVKDGSLFGSKKGAHVEVKEPPSAFAGGALIAADPGATAKVVDKHKVEDAEKVVAIETPSADDLLRQIQQAEANAQAHILQSPIYSDLVS